jgi:hypothetical protein
MISSRNFIVVIRKHQQPSPVLDTNNTMCHINTRSCGMTPHLLRYPFVLRANCLVCRNGHSPVLQRVVRLPEQVLPVTVTFV